MTYRQRTKDIIKASPLTDGSRLGRRAVYLDISVVEVAGIIGATRKTCYNWFGGGLVIPAYRARVRHMYEIFKDAPTRDDALRRSYKAFAPNA